MSNTIRKEEERIEDSNLLDAYAQFVAVVRRLRKECPWDREQTHASIKHLLIEEAYETVAAIDEENWDELKKELGDLLLHVVFHGTLAEDAGTFSLESVIRTESEKLIRRHPHVYGDTVVSGTEQVLANWEQIKMKEGKKKSVLEGVPRHLPALLQAQRIQEKVAGVGFDFPEATGAWEKVVEEIEEFNAEVLAKKTDINSDALEEELGDVLFSLVNYARFIGVTPENALRRTNMKFTRRFQYIEAQLAEQERRPVDATLEEMDVLWEKAKQKDKE